MLPSRYIQRLGRRGIIAPKAAKRFSKWMEHAEHAGGTVVGIEFLMPHYFSAFVLTVLAASFVLARIWASEVAELS